MKILYVNYAMNMGGIENFLMNVTRKIANKYEIDYLCYSDEKFLFEEELNKLNCNILRITSTSKCSPLKHFFEIKKIIKKGKYDVVHCNTYTDSGYVMFAAFLCGVKVRICHSHTSQKSISFLQKMKWSIGKTLIKLFSNKKVACSDVAGKALYGRSKFEIIENGIDINKFSFNSLKREELRKKYNINDSTIVIGHIGRFAEVKNHKFIIEVAKTMKEKQYDFRILLLGDGPEFNNINKMVNEYNLEKYVIFVGNVFDAYNYYNAMDAFIFPSLYEGLPLTLVEAQINGLNIISSNNVSTESNLFGNVEFISLDEKIDIWVSKLINASKGRNFNMDFFNDSYYNLDNTVKKIENIYNNKNN